MCVYSHVMPPTIRATWKALADPVRREILDLLRRNRARPGTSVLHFRPDALRGAPIIWPCSESWHASGRAARRERLNHIEQKPLRAAYEEWFRNYECFGRANRSLEEYVDERRDFRMMQDNSLPTANLVTLNIEQTLDSRLRPLSFFVHPHSTWVNGGTQQTRPPDVATL